mmetsp:Transcript_10011/g.31540  ORF Transcript_10011/g.31540 Transcript_10011/m.31540 type:complete len:290 (+) Transcript_10011:4030-4899(+)
MAGLRRITATRSRAARCFEASTLIRATRHVIATSGPLERMDIRALAHLVAIALGFFLLLRKEHYAYSKRPDRVPTLAEDKDRLDRLIRRGDVQFDFKGGSPVRVRVHLRGGGKSPTQAPYVLLPMERSGSVFCLVSLLWVWACRTRSVPGGAPILAVWDATGRGGLRMAVTRESINVFCRWAATLDPSIPHEDLRRYTSHGLRRGGASAMSAAGRPEADLRLYGQWSSQSLYAYTSATTRTARDLAVQMISSGTSARSRRATATSQKQRSTDRRVHFAVEAGGQAPSSQ